jgi:hypothetical protein
MSAPRVRIGRIVVALALVFCGIGALASAYVAGEHMGMHRQRQRIWGPEVQRGDWFPSMYTSAGLDELDVWGVAQEPGNAVAIYWPDGVVEKESPCVRVSHGPFDSPIWNDGRSPWREAAACDRIDQIVRAAHLRDMNLSEWLRSAGPADVPGPEDFLGLNRAPMNDVAALIARAHLRIVDNNLADAEADARAAVSAGLHFMRGALSIDAMFWASVYVTEALDHLREVHERRGDVTAVRQLTEAVAKVQRPRRVLTRFMDMAPKAASSTALMTRLVQIATNRQNPIGMRAHATTMLGYGFLANPVEVLFGPSLIRQQALDSIEQQDELAAVVAHAREAFDRPLRDRLALLGQFAMLN